MSTALRALSLPARLSPSQQSESFCAPLIPSSSVEFIAPTVGVLPRASALYFGTATVDSSGRVYNRTAVDLLAWSRGDRLLVTVVGVSVLFHRRPDGIFAMTAKPYVVLPAAVRSRCAIRSGSRVLIAADADHDVLVVHPAAVVETMLGDLHARLAGGGPDDRESH